MYIIMKYQFTCSPGDSAGPSNCGWYSMWLLDTEDGSFHHVDRPREHRYAILSHVWQPSGEQSFQDLLALRIRATKKQTKLKRFLTAFHPLAPDCALTTASAKIRKCCELARRHGYRRVWIDSCCIDKTSSTELSEAINSMYEWYAAADICFAFLEDVSDDHDPRLKDSKFRRSRWFTRGWTLQELIAPAVVVFVSKEWRLLGTKASLAGLVEEMTGIDRAVLMHEKSLDAISVARRMSWASKRQTTRLEDKAYSLMGIFGVNMPTIYGEGGNAFIRLQEEILKQVPDQSIFVWGPVIYDDAVLYRNLDSQSVSDDGRYWQSRNLFAWSPDAFVNSGSISSLAPEAFQKRTGIPFVLSEYTVTSYGIRSRLPLIPIRHSPEKTTYLAVLGCEDREGRIVALLLYPRVETAGRFFVGHYIGRPQVPPNSFFRAVSLSASRLTELLEAVEVTDVCIPYRISPTAHRTPLMTPSRPTFKCPCEVVVPTWSVAEMEKAGFATCAATTRDDNVLRITEVAPPQSPVLVLASASETVHIRMGRCQCRGRFLSVSVTGTKSGMRAPARTPPAHLTATAPAVSSNNSQPFIARCPADHVAMWEGGSKVFACEKRQLRLTFSPWMARADMYSLEIFMGEDLFQQGPLEINNELSLCKRASTDVSSTVTLAAAILA
ncbi:HET-domain-containing protein [Trametes maxima]|nr:HET-domain-containing protein [Trametes maxima]